MRKFVDEIVRESHNRKKKASWETEASNEKFKHFSAGDSQLTVRNLPPHSLTIPARPVPARPSSHLHL